MQSVVPETVQVHRYATEMGTFRPGHPLTEPNRTGICLAIIRIIAMVHTEPDDEEDYEGDVAFYSTTDSASYLELVELVGKSV